jgi:hypothetical protein
MVQSHQAVTLGSLLLVSLALACGNTDHQPPAASGASGAASEGGEGGVASQPGPEEMGGHDSGSNQAGADVGGEAAGGAGTAPVVDGAFYASSVESFEPGEAAGFNEDKLPDIVLGPPHGMGTGSGSLDVLSLGGGGEIVLGFGEHGLADGPGPDFVVFENAFWPGGDESQVYAELGEVSVSDDGETWRTFPCDTEGDGQGHFPGCAGATPTLQYDADQLVPLDPKKSGGDAFDLADLGVIRARFIKIRDLQTLAPSGVSGGFDLDAVGVIHAASD